jgi:hypothetical protein
MGVETAIMPVACGVFVKLGIEISRPAAVEGPLAKEAACSFMASIQAVRASDTNVVCPLIVAPDIDVIER